MSESLASSSRPLDLDLPVRFNALAVEHAGGPIILQQKSIESLADDEVLIRTHYASINSMDPKLARRNVFQFAEPYVVGFDFSGQIVRMKSADEFRSKTSTFKPGDQVFGKTAGRGGCFAEFVVAKLDEIALQGDMPPAEASTLGIAYLTAYESLIITGEIQRNPGKWIYIAGAGGGLGHFAAQIAKLSGLKVIGSAGKPASLRLLKGLELDGIIDYSKQDVVQEIMDLTNGKGADVVFDPTYSQASYIQSASVVASGGEYIRLGTEMQLKLTGAQDMRSQVEGRGAKFTIGDLGRYSTDPHYKAQTSKVLDGMKSAVQWYDEGKLKPVITEVVLFDPVALQLAFEEFLNGTNNVGKVVVKCTTA